jgi:hypothetical protein
MTKAGDIFEIRTSRGIAYFQFVKKLPLMGSLIRILPGVYDSAPPNWLNLVNRETNFWIFLPVSAAIKRGIVKRIHHFEVPDHARQTPVFRSGVVDPQTGKVRIWWLWDGEKEWRVDTVTEEQRRLPILASWNDTLLVERIEQDGRPEKDLR